MPELVYNKLIRDRIPEIIEAEGKHAVIEIILPDQILTLLDAKLNEEKREYQSDKSLEELADILEVIHGILYHKGIQWNELEAIRLSKHEKRGGFEKGIFLHKIIVHTEV